MGPIQRQIMLAPRKSQPFLPILQTVLPQGLPNNRTGFFGEDCWEFDAERCEYYLHLFAKSQADLNYHNPAVLEEVKDILRFWLRKGVAGVRGGVINIDRARSTPIPSATSPGTQKTL